MRQELHRAYSLSLSGSRAVSSQSWDSVENEQAKVKHNNGECRCFHELVKKGLGFPFDADPAHMSCSLSVGNEVVERALESKYRRQRRLEQEPAQRGRRHDLENEAQT
jgi:hypothetical protein